MCFAVAGLSAPIWFVEGKKGEPAEGGPPPPPPPPPPTLCGGGRYGHCMRGKGKGMSLCRFLENGTCVP